MMETGVSAADATRQAVQDVLTREKIRFEVVHIGERTNKDGWVHDEWAVTLGKWHTEYSTGLGWRTKRRLNFDRCMQRCTCLKCHALPKVQPADVLSSLFLDARAGTQSFHDWCGEMGYDTDSRKALDTFLKCSEIGEELRKVFSPLVRAELEKLLEDW